MNTWNALHDRISLTYDEAGTGDGPPLVLLHAYPQCREMWAPQLVALSGGPGGGRRVLAPDLFGFGGSPVPDGGWTVDTAADALADFLDGIGITVPVVLGGLSMGGYVALAFARHYPSQLAGLILADTKGGADTAEVKAGRNKSIELVRDQRAGAVIDQMIPRLLGATTHAKRPEVVTAVRQMGAAQSIDGVAAALVALRDRPDATPNLASINVPTLVIVGAEDVLTPPDVARELAAAIPGAKLEVVPAAGHLSNLEAPDEFNAIVQRFLTTV
ncbi:alpha/beta fold hydrolase [Fimbriiglobus ruber]|nr:alpha/beta fold hydrolase [Fimbriiglobus ruber]